jgi:hypothetical protein
MLEKIDSNKYKFNVRQVEYEVFFADDGQIEIYEAKNPEKTGFFFSDKKKFVIFINMLTDVADRMTEIFGVNNESS